jgi:hypothetical protein
MNGFAMPKHRLCSSVLLLTGCWLVLLASGDDINFARLVLPPTDSPLEDVMPFDDPNFDFTQPGTPPPPQLGEPSDGQNQSRTASLRPSTPTDGFRTRTDRHIPLRC